MLNNITADVGHGRVSFADPTTIIYVAWRATRSDPRDAMRRIFHHGMMRPVPGDSSKAERVYPIEFIPTDDPRVWIVFLRNDHAELIEATLHETYNGDNTPAPDSAEDMRGGLPNPVGL